MSTKRQQSKVRVDINNSTGFADYSQTAHVAENLGEGKPKLISGWQNTIIYNIWVYIFKEIQGVH
jgi:hypothetical protein